MQATTQLTAQDIHKIVQMVGVDNFADRIDVDTLPQHKLDKLTADLIKTAPMHVAVVQTRHLPAELHADAAIDRMRQLTGQETSR